MQSFVKKNKFVRSFWNFCMSFVSFFINGLIGFVITPLIIQYVGSYRFGLFKVLYEYSAYLFFCELGLTYSIVAILSKSVASENRLVIKRNLQGILFQFLKTYPLILLGIGLLLLLIPKDVNIPDFEYYAGFGVLCLIPFFSPLNAFREFLKSGQRDDLVSRASVPQTLSISGLSLLLTYLGWGVLGLSSAHFLGMFVYYSLILFFTFREYRKYPLKETSPGTFDAKALWATNKHSMAISLSSQMSYFTDNIIIGHVMGAERVTSFFLNQRLPNLCQQVSQALGNATWASLIHFFHQGELEIFRQRFYFVNKIVAIFSVSLLSCMAAFNMDFVRLWMGESYLLSMYFTWVVCLSTFFHSIISFWIWLVLSSGHLKQQTPIFLISGFVNLTLSIVLAKTVGIMGPVLATLMTFVFIHYWMLSRVLVKVFGLLLSRICWPTLVCLFVGIVFCYVKHRISPPVGGWLVLMVSMGIYFVMVLVVTGFCTLNAEQRGYLWQRLEGILRRGA